MVKKLLFILFLSCTSIVFSQENSIDGLSAAPNPFTNTTKISFSSDSKSTIYFTVKNVLGKTVFRKSIQTKPGKNNIPFYKNDLPNGMYIYSIQDKKKTISKRLVIR
ncbi:T9SS type A sorting domain-containing protein [Polaribacter sp. Z014]|uniref:T9SS type A sorting domain-containing protein n=1 Tax=unclassified Polaribacter TaxID=196858 RepID=UPI00193B448A|nr:MULTISPECIES: T9SS type A sorting domain-containing protein [unclassified Polaribacter]MCL7764165.1 T9SS type A sorting domain-containing protein [Polaribacter sp. Z014]QVY65747.1 T9SS type A sorting domain-containing protein [Polaribacter sp. Q13]